jgi:uncharacterized protein YggE
MDRPVVAVRGVATREVPPEIARISVEVSARDADRQATLTRLAERVAAVRAALEPFAAAIERRETSSLNVWPETKGRVERVTAYHGSANTTITVNDLTVLGDLMLRLAEQDQTSVSGPWWAVRPDSPVHREIRRAAVGDAVQRAREYAEAVGAGLVRLLEISDVGVGGPEPMAVRALGFTGGAADSGPAFDLDPQLQTVRAEVVMRFTITEPVQLTGPDAAEPAG